jgi:tRNA(Arg) A34 adenosine deaminase TadA
MPRSYFALRQHRAGAAAETLCGVTDQQLRHLTRAIELAADAREHGNHPFGSLLVDGDGNVVLEAENTVVTGRDGTAHAEHNLVRAAVSQFEPDQLATFTLYTSTEPCAMCAGAIFWSGIGRVVFALSSATLAEIVRDPTGAWTLAVSCRDVFARGGRAVEVHGPLIEDRARVVHEGFWETA